MPFGSTPAGWRLLAANKHIVHGWSTQRKFRETGATYNFAAATADAARQTEHALPQQIAAATTRRPLRALARPSPDG
jgi:hypothetical protein